MFRGVANLTDLSNWPRLSPPGGRSTVILLSVTSDLCLSVHRGALHCDSAETSEIKKTLNCGFCQDLLFPQKRHTFFSFSSVLELFPRPEPRLFESFTSRGTQTRQTRPCVDPGAGVWTWDQSLDLGPEFKPSQSV
ncbi:hypothetical protein WMY93_031812 [Mugilogobius chulae]|uniref:Uncharacterized protein n=1 Tax=Mugilogobius chulae TaxID=88201 RepID=A0AAW0MK60_9GOBI